MITFYTKTSGWVAPIAGSFAPTTTQAFFKFPGQEMHVESYQHDEVAVLISPNSDDLIALRLWADCRRRKGLRCNAVIPYLPGARQDRGAPLSAAVYADIINGAKLDRLVCLDPHSDVMPALLNNCIVIPQWDVLMPKPAKPFTHIIAPDAGASKKAFNIALILGLPMIQALKHRDIKTGKLSGFSCEEFKTSADTHALVVDDICDGGGTFMGLAKYLGDHLRLGTDHLSLYVTHGIFSGSALSNLTTEYGRVYTTDSMTQEAHPQLTVIPMIHTLIYCLINNIVPRN